MRWTLGLVVLLLLLAADLWQRRAPAPEPRAVWPLVAQSAGSGRLVLQAAGRIPMPDGVPVAHASTLLALPAGEPAALMAFWFAGSRESGPDVRIACSQWHRLEQKWSPAHFVVSRDIGARELGLGLRRLGNPVAWRDTQGRIHLFVVATGLGGWAAARILHLRQSGTGRDCADLGLRAVGMLPLSWLWNTSHLVRAMPMPLADGGMLLPAYFELGTKYPVALRFNAQGGYLGMTRISRRGDLLQPTLLARGETDWLALMRDSSAGRKIRVAATSDGGRHWRDQPELDMPNPDSSLVGLTLHPGLMVLAHNPRPDTRAELELGVSADGLHWTRAHVLARGEASGEYSYPSLAWADDSLWISYTDQRRAIAWQRMVFVPALR